MRQRFTTRTLLLRNEQVRNNLMSIVRNLPLDDAFPLEVVIREQIKGRKLDQNALYHAGPLRDIALQAWVEGKQFSKEVWHEWLKRELLPEEFDPELCMENYQKWAQDPSGNPVMVGSTTMLTKKGFSAFLEGVYAFGAAYGVNFTAAQN